MPCIPGRANPLEGQRDCQVCREDTFIDVPEATACTACTAGRTAGNASASCSACSAGKRLHAADQTCAACAAGQFSEFQNAPECTLCPAGYAQNDTRAAACVPCFPGTYADTLGQNLCTACPRGRFQPAQRATACQAV